MIRFAVAVTIVELLLTGAAAIAITLNETPEPFLTREDLAEARLGIESIRHERKQTIQALFNYETHGMLQDPRQAFYVSYRIETGPKDFEVRQQKETIALGKSGEGTIIDDPFDGERGYALRHQTASAVRAELVRAKGTDLLVVRVSQDQVRGVEGKIAVAQCDRRARLIQQLMLDKLRWRY